MRDYLLFQLYGPLAAWGEPAVGQERDSAVNPSKSAVLGLVASSLGIGRDQDEQHVLLTHQLGLGVKLCAQGYGLRDFQTAQRATAIARTKHLQTRCDELGHDKLATVISYRAYRQDTAAIVALWCRQPALGRLQQIAESLRKPMYPLYLGRRSCPLAVPLNPKLQVASSLREALDSYSLDQTVEELLQVQGETAPYFWDATEDAGMQADYSTQRHDTVLSRVRWQHSARTEQVMLKREKRSDHVSE